MNKRVIQSMGPCSTLPVAIRIIEQVCREHGEAINWFVGGFSRIEIIATADLPAANAVMDGREILEDTGSTINRIVYANGARYRFAGVSF